jgi:xanthine dehydrogenase accessory factor
MKPTELLQEINALLAAGKSFVVAKVVRCDGDLGLAPGDAWIVHASGHVDGALEKGAFSDFLSSRGREVLSSREARTFRFTVGETGDAPASGKGPQADIFFDPLAVPEPLFIAGGGHIAVPLTDMAAQAGFRVTVVDDRREFSEGGRFPRAHEVVTAPFGEFFRCLETDPAACVVIITRGHRHDRECLEAVLDGKLAYIGMIGSRRRIATVFDSLRKKGVPRARLDRIHSPIGLDIGALTPAEIAVSILAELVAVRRLGSSSLSLSRKGQAAR